MRKSRRFRGEYRSRFNKKSRNQVQVVVHKKRRRVFFSCVRCGSYFVVAQALGVGQ